MSISPAVLRITLVVKCIYFINLPVVNRRPSSGTKNTTLETHTCKSPLLYSIAFSSALKNSSIE